MIPRVALGQGFFGAFRPKVSDAHVYPVNVSNGMPVVSNKKPISEKVKGKSWPKKLKKGRFTKYCGGKPTQVCADKAMSSSDPSVRGMASFWRNTTLKNPKTRSSVLGNKK